MKNYLVHHGILGQKWGKKNGPPYPLDYRKLSDEEREKAKSDAIRRGDVKEANAHHNRDYYTDQELNNLLNRFDYNRRLTQKIKDIDDAKINRGIEKVKRFSETAGTLANVMEAGTRAYNAFAKISNSLTDSEFKIIGERSDKGTSSITKEYSNGKLTKKTTSSTKDGVSKKTIENFGDGNKKGNSKGISEDRLYEILEEYRKKDDD